MHVRQANALKRRLDELRPAKPLAASRSFIGVLIRARKVVVSTNVHWCLIPDALRSADSTTGSVGLPRTAQSIWGNPY